MSATHASAPAPVRPSAGRLRAVLVSLEREMLAAECDQVTIPGKLGEFGVLPGHAALIASLGIGELQIRSGAKTQYFAISGGFCEVRDDVVTVLVDSAETPEQIDVAAAEATRVEAAKQVAAALDESFQVAMAALALAETRLRVAARR